MGGSTLIAISSEETVSNVVVRRREGSDLNNNHVHLKEVSHVPFRVLISHGATFVVEEKE